MRLYRFASVFVLSGGAAFAQQPAQICTDWVATFNVYAGTRQEVAAGQRVELRSCPIDSSGNGILQLVAWGQAAPSSPLIVDMSDGFVTFVNRVATTESTYAFEFGQGRTARLVVIDFTDGKPRLALDVENQDGFALETNGKALTARWTDRSGREQVRRFYHP